MRRVAILLALVVPSAVTAQTSLHFGVGLRYSSALVRDSIVSPLAVRLGMASVLTASATMPLEHGWTAEAVLDYSWSGLARHENDTVVGLGTTGTLAVSVALRRALGAGVSGRIGIGGIRYVPAGERWVFRQGTPPLIALGSAGVRYEPPRWGGLAVEVRYDAHRFITPALRSAGFTSSRLVHRVALVLSGPAAGRGGGR